MKFKTFMDYDPSKLDERVNNFIADKEVIDYKLSATSATRKSNYPNNIVVSVITIRYKDKN